MEEELEILAWGKTEKAVGVTYSSKQLSNSVSVEALFKQCKIDKAVILSAGWEYLFDQYGLAGLVEIDKSSQWLIKEDLGEWISNIVFFALMSGFNPLLNIYGDYDEASGIFLPNHGGKTMMNWDEVYQLKEKVHLKSD